MGACHGACVHSVRRMHRSLCICEFCARHLYVPLSACAYDTRCAEGPASRSHAMSQYPRYLSHWPQPLSAEALDALPPDRLHEYYHDRQLRYMGVIAPPYTARFTLSRRTPSHLVRLEDNVTITVDQAAFAMEMMLSPTSLQPKATDGHGERTRWFGAEVLQNPVDSSTLAMHLATHQPDLLLEVGTNCGGSALLATSSSLVAFV